MIVIATRSEGKLRELRDKGFVRVQRALGSDVNTVVIGGRVAMEEGKLKLMDVDALFREVRDFCSKGLTEEHQKRAEMLAKIDGYVKQGRNPHPAEVHLQTKTLRYNKMYWVEIDGLEVQTRITDRGIGIPADEIPQLFERFHRARNVSSRYYGGLGLGLYIARAIIEAHDGSISVQSVEGEGSTFTMRLPRAD